MLYGALSLDELNGHRSGRSAVLGMLHLFKIQVTFLKVTFFKSNLYLS